MSQPPERLDIKHTRRKVITKDDIKRWDLLEERRGVIVDDFWDWQTDDGWKRPTRGKSPDVDEIILEDFQDPPVFLIDLMLLLLLLNALML